MLRRLIKMILLCALMISPLVLFHWHYENFARKLIYQQNVHYEKANALKHAYASAEIMDILLRITTAEKAERTVLWLGDVNEYLEQIIRFPQDTPAEIVKDLSNNQVGITLAMWRRVHQPEMSLETLVLHLADQPALVASAKEITLSEQEAALRKWAAVEIAKKRFAENRQAMITRTQTALAKALQP